MGVYYAYNHLPTSYIKFFSSKIKQKKKKIKVASLRELFFRLCLRESETSAPQKKTYVRLV